MDDKLKRYSTEIIKMADEDQKMRLGEKWDDSVDIKNTKRLKEIIAEIGWPTISKVGPRASHMAWLLAQHADIEPTFQADVLELMKEQEPGDVEPHEIAYLEDRVRVNTGRPQLYGTQLKLANGKMEPSQMENQENVDKRRSEAGLGPLAEYVDFANDKNATYGSYIESLKKSKANWD